MTTTAQPLDERLQSLHGKVAAAHRLGRPAEALTRELRAVLAIVHLTRDLDGLTLTADERVALMALVTSAPKADDEVGVAA
ncbi:hypothetical protein [Gordonia hongkongensis]|uniref:hypothetical protein n=1 Tax=Gordonia hongkongensis TaxID=1701090 RepID=UPI003D737C5E